MTAMLFYIPLNMNYNLYRQAQFQNTKCGLRHPQREFAQPLCWYYSRQENSTKLKGTLVASSSRKSVKCVIERRTNIINIVYVPFHAVWWLKAPTDLKFSRQRLFICFVLFSKQRETIFLKNIKRLSFLMETQCFYRDSENKCLYILII
jgi:hypothetical protein